MAFSNNMTKLLNKIENRLGVKLLNLPPQLAKETWAPEVIIPDTLMTWSRFFPNQVEYPCGRALQAKDGWYIIDEEFIEGVEIIGIRDLDWKSFTNDNVYYQQEIGLGTLDYISLQAGMSFEDIATIQMRKDINSLFNSGIFVEFKAPNMFKLTSATNAELSRSFMKYKIILLIKHSDSLLTISPTMMETFEELAISDVAGYLYRNLKYYDGGETAYGNIDLKLDELQEQMGKRDNIVENLRNSSVSADNPSIPLIMTI